MSVKPAGHLNNSIVKAFTLLEYFSNVKTHWGVRELSREIGLHESTTYRLMSTLESLGVLYKNPETEKYALGLKLHELGNRVKVFDSVVSLSHPVLNEVALEIEETVHLGIWHKGEVLMIDKVECEKGLRLDSRIGQTSPPHCTGLGKILLAFDYIHKNEFLEASDRLVSFTPNTITHKDKLKEELEKIHRQQYALDNQEFELGLICLAVPVFNNKGKLIAAISAAGPSVRFKKDQLKDYVEILKRGAEKLTHKIGNL